MTRQKITAFNYSFLLCAMAVSMLVSNWLMNLVWVLLLVNWIVEWNWKEKFSDFRHNHLLHAVLVLFAMHLVGMLWTSNFHYGINDIRQKLPLLAVPLVVLTSKPLAGFRWAHLKMVYVVAVVVVAIIGVVRHLVIPDLPYRELNPWISHIRFSLNVCLALSMLFLGYGHYASFRQAMPPRLSRIMPERDLPWRILDLLLMLFLLAYLLLQQSYTGFVVLFVIMVVAAIRSHRHRALAAMLGVVLLLAAVSSYHIYDYYHLRSLAQGPLAEFTPNGNRYEHRQDGFVECGGYVDNYVCWYELYREWPKHSSMDLDSITEVGYPVKGALVRYLTCMNLPKDSLGVSRLSPADVANLEKGIANPSYARQGSLKKFFDQILYEFESSRRSDAVKGFTMLERFELWRNGVACISQHPLLGVGTGDVVDVEHARLAAIGSPIADTTKHIHNQYLTLILTFGLVGFIVIIYFFVKALARGPRMPMLNVAFLLLILVSFVNEDTLETLAGIMLVALWGSLLSRKRTCTNITH